jgi:NAD(P)-dependent dehydrogenase (short-subunit alcohol dehydrogenase family)
LDLAAGPDGAGGSGFAHPNDLESLVKEISSLGRQALAVPGDVSDEAAVEAAVTQASDELGPITLVANVAGGPGHTFGPLVSVDADAFQRVLDINLIGTWLVSRACANRMLAAGIPGRICNTSSQASKTGFELMGAYGAAKAAINILTQVLAKELGPSGIAVNAVCPGGVDTEPTRRFAEQFLQGGEGAEEYIRTRIPLGRLQTPEEIAAAISWLLSEEASGVTGATLNVTGGETLG